MSTTMKSEAVLFLDMDGVLASPRAMVARGHDPTGDPNVLSIDPIAVGLFNRLCAEHDPAVVVSSAWRHNNELRGLLKGAGVRCRFHADWRTCFEGGFRGDQIREWLKRHPEVERYVILDDESDFHPDQPLVLCDLMNGLHVDAFRVACDILGGTHQPGRPWLSYRVRAEQAEAEVARLREQLAAAGVP